MPKFTDFQQIVFRLLPFLPLLISLNTFSQSAIHGEVKDPGGERLFGVNVLLLTHNDSLVRGEVSDTYGRFSFEKIPNERYILKIQSLGYQSTILELNVDKDIILGEIILNTTVSELDEIVVTSHKQLIEIHGGKTVINVKESTTAVGGSALSVIERSPGILINRINSSISLNGKEGVQVLINGKRLRLSDASLVQYLSNLSSSNIKNIELMSSPPSTYEAGGNAGVLNIILEEDLSLGTSGTIQFNSGYGKGEKAGLNLSAMRSIRAMSISTSLGFDRNRSNQYVQNTRSIYSISDSTLSTTTNDRDPLSTNLSGNIGINYNLSPTTEITTSLVGQYNIWNMTASSQNKNNDLIRREETIVEVNNIEEGRKLHYEFGMNINHQLKENEILNLSLDYISYADKNKTRYRFDVTSPNDASDSVITRKDTPMKSYVADLGYSGIIKKGTSLEVGVKGILSNLRNRMLYEDIINNEPIINKVLSENSNLNEKIAGAYSSIKYEIDEKSYLTLGLRYEYSNTKINLVNTGERHNIVYNNIFPNLFIQKKIKEKSSVTASYNRRITRPSFNDLAPFFIFIDQSTFYTGNVKLRPAINDNFKIGTSWLTNNISLEYTNEKNYISKFQPVIIDEENTQMFTSINMKYRKSLNLILYSPIIITPNWDVNLSIIGQKVNIKTLKDKKLEQYSFNVHLSQTYRLPRKYTIEFTGFYNSKSLSGAAIMGNYYNFNTGLKKIFKDESTITLNMTNLFGFKNKVHFVGDVETARAITTYNFESWIVNIGYKKSLGIGRGKTNQFSNKNAQEIRNRLH